MLTNSEDKNYTVDRLFIEEHLTFYNNDDFQLFRQQHPDYHFGFIEMNEDTIKVIIKYEV